MTDIVPNQNDIKTYMHVLFSGCSGLIPCRSFPEKAKAKTKPPRNIWIEADDEVISRASRFANKAAKAQTSFFVIPGTVEEQGQAGANHIKQMQVLLIDIDSGDTENKLQILSKVLGQPTMVVESGGVMESGHSKLHVYWQLWQAASGNDLKKLVALRHKIALSVGGDSCFKSAHQPIRIAGSVYHKGGVSRLVKIRSYEPVEYDLEELIKASELLPKTYNAGVNTEGGNSLLNYNSAVPIESIITSKVHEGGEGEATRFNHLQRIIGFWLRRYHDGVIHKKQALEEISAYNQANVNPPWPEDKLKQMVEGLWKKHVKENGEARSKDKPIIQISSHPLRSYLNDKDILPQDIIAPRVLTPAGMFVFGGAPKVGKSDFLLSLFTHLAAGREFLGLKPPRPLRIFYFQAEIGYHYLRERLQNMDLSDELIELGQDNLQITPNSKLLLNEKAVDSLAKHILEVFAESPDIIAVDPIRNVFDAGRDGVGENDNDAMLFFLQQRIEALRDAVNPDSGIVLVHHTKKLTQKQFDEEPFAAFSGASSLRGYYSSGAILRRSDVNPEERELIFELRNGAEIPTKILKKNNGMWVEENVENRRVALKKKSSLFDRERDRRVKVILELLKSEALKGKFYLMKQFGEKFRNTHDLGNKRAIYDDCSAAATKGLIKFFDNPEIYKLQLVDKGKASFGFMCTENMKIFIGESVDPETGEISENYKMILPTHYKHDGDGRKKAIVHSEIWDADLDEMEVKNV